MGNIGLENWGYPRRIGGRYNGGLVKPLNFGVRVHRILDRCMSDISQTSGSTSSSSLLLRVVTQDPEAWQRLARLYGPVVYRWARQGGLQSNDAADVVQEVFQTVAQRIDQYHGDGTGDAFRGWLWGITRNKLREFFRGRAAEPVGAGGTEAHQQFQQFAAQLPEDSVSFDGANIRPALLQRALKLLQAEFEPRTVQAFWQATIDGRTTADIAADLGMTTKAVRQAKYRVLRRLRQEFENLL